MEGGFRGRPERPDPRPEMAPVAPLLEGVREGTAAPPERIDTSGGLLYTLVRDSDGAWRSLVAHLLWEQRVPSSNLGAPTPRQSG